MSLRITTPTSFADNNIGWKAPVSAQPAFASFFNGTLANLAPGGTAMTALTGAKLPQLNAGTLGSVLPSATIQTGTYCANLNVPQTSQMTIMALINAPAPTQQEPLVATYGQDGARTLAWAPTKNPGTQMHAFVETAASNSLFADLNDGNFGNWMLACLTLDVSTTTGVVINADLTNGLSTDTSQAITADTGSGPSLVLGNYGLTPTSPDTYATQIAFLGIWDSVLASADQQTMRAFLQNYTAQYGQTC
ncbi:hypothetical protein [Tanticharoenia sakaeratensis]|uniref:Uncharacterized protein n=1 Tax=Tanticharoenia sakaeratensis NBRC 103193 TaxID=1231623 RepID=A0A0D6MPC7_9PROT|nr:hypothetical protein [Tanticharoenia sakaeratensis]GAN55281.1 hypothetical protein Tasa_041_076 [Tanticharoenia sakaeratensis NBRC 103193]GBQ23440.1 hypothetical protein AA103193_2418 [Tanticharoenia sakaeratensis NBRC 103193]